MTHATTWFRRGIYLLVLVFAVSWIGLDVGAEEGDAAAPPAAEKKADPAPAKDAPAEPPRRRGAADPSPDLGPDTPMAPPRGSAREAMWPAPTAEDWAKPVLIQFQRTWEDAVAISEETGKPILICISMDGEIASEHYAGVRYRDPEIAELYKPYVCVIASVYRHNPRDHDDEGNRILCPRFGCVTCGEHIQIEPVIYEKYCEGKRIAPRHICVDLQKKEVYDVYYANDTASVFSKIKDGASHLPPAKPRVIRGDRPVLERVASRHIDDREAVEAAYKKGELDLRKKLLEAAIDHGEAAQLDLLRMAIFGLDVDLAKTAREALTRVSSPNATTLISQSLRVPMDAAERDALIAALKKIGDTSPVARWLAGVHKGLTARSTSVNAKAWAGAAGRPPEASADPDTLSAQAEYQAQATEMHPNDPAPRLDLAEANLNLALQAPQTYPDNQRMARMVATHLFADAAKSAKEAEALGAKGYRVHMILALTAYYSGDPQAAYAHAETAMAALPVGDPSWKSMALVTVFAEARWKAIKKAVKAKEDWPSKWLADLHEAYGVLQNHPLGTDGQVDWHYGFLEWLGADHRAGQVLREGLTRFQDSELLHKRFRERLLKQRDPATLEDAYAKLIDDQGVSASLMSYAGLGSVRAAEHYRRQRKYDDAVDAYDRAIAYFGAAEKLDETFVDFTDRAAALAHAAKARVWYLLKDDEKATASIIASFERGPTAAGTRDAMGITPGETAQMLIARLRKHEKIELATKLEIALSRIDPDLLVPDIGLMPGR